MVGKNLLLFKHNNLKKYRTIVKNYNPHETILITYVEIMSQAINYCISKNPVFPKICIIDISDKNKDYVRKNIEKYKLEIIYLQDIIFNNRSNNILIYSKEVSHMWDRNAFWNLAFLMHRYCITDRYRIAYESISQIPWKMNSHEDYIIKNIDDIAAIYNFLEDEASKHIFLCAIKCISTGDAGYLPISRYPQYDHPYVRVTNSDYVIEGGLEQGYSTLFLSNSAGPSGMVYGFEALPKHYERTRKFLSHSQNIKVENLGLWSCETDFYIQDKGGGSHMVNTDPGNAEKCHTTSIDIYMHQNNIRRCDCIKLDIEGAEMECLKGAIGTIKKFNPKLMISLYHLIEHYLTIPLWIKSNFPEYRIYIGHHSPWYGETCLYAYKP